MIRRRRHGRKAPRASCQAGLCLLGKGPAMPVPCTLRRQWNTDDDHGTRAHIALLSGARRPLAFSVKRDR